MTSVELGVRSLNKDQLDIKNLSICIYNNETDDITDERIEEFSLQHSIYNLLSNNSEHFIIFIKMGRVTCDQFKPLEHAIVK